MPIEYRKADLLEQDDINVIIHQANCHHTMGSGIAAAIKKKYPEAYAADLKTGFGDISKMGTYSKAITKDGKRILNLYSQFNFGYGKRHTDYNAMANGMALIRKDILAAPNKSKLVLGMPYKIGSALGGGSWRVVEAIIHDTFEESGLKLVICELENTLYQK